MTLVSKLQHWYKSRKEARFLKKHHCTTWEQYHHRFDADVTYRAIELNNFYHGYNFVVAVEDSEHFAYTLLYDYGPGGHNYGYSEMSQWCKDNCKDKFRVDVHRVIKQYNGTWCINELGGGDYIFFAFKNDEDVVWFRLKWGT